MAAAGASRLHGRTATAGTARVCCSTVHKPCHTQLGTIVALPAPSRALLAPAAVAPPSDTHRAVHPIPQRILDDISAVNAQWAQAAIAQPLVEPSINAQVILLGVTPFAPLQQQAVQAVLESGITPQAVALDLPPSTFSQARIALPYPQVLQLLLDLQDEGVLMQDGDGHTAASKLQGLLDELGRDIPSQPLARSCSFLDPFEALGYYPSLDYVLAPQQLGRAHHAFAFMPGVEYAHALQYALQAEAELVLLDAALRNQEAWVSGLVKEFRLQESDLGRQLGLELQAAQQLVPVQHSQWDAELSLAAAARMQQHTEHSKHNHADTDLVVAYKVCKACAAALLGPQDAATGQAVTLQARLQPLKFAHFELRALHMAGQLRELCRWRAPTPVLSRPTASSTSSTLDSSSAPGDSTANSSQSPHTSHENEDSDASQPIATFTVLAVVARQYVPMIRRLWNDPKSALWRGDVPHTFAPSKLELVPRTELDPDTASGGSRPVGQKSVTLGQFLDKGKAAT